MFLDHKLVVDLTNKRKNVIHVVQDDSTRRLEITLLANGSAYDVGADLAQGEAVVGLVSFCKPDGNGGQYDTANMTFSAATPASGSNPKELGLYEKNGYFYKQTKDTSVQAGKTYYSGSGETAVSRVAGTQNCWVAILDGQCFTAPGITTINVSFFTENGKFLSTFSIEADVQANAASTAPSGSYYRIESIADLREAVQHSVLFSPQTLTDAQKSQARQNIGATDILDVEHAIDHVMQPLEDSVVKHTAQTLTDAQKAQARQNIDAISADGNYPNLTAGKAQMAAQLEATVATEDRRAYSFRTAGGTMDIGDTLRLKKLVGGTVCRNQLCKNYETVTRSDVTATNDGHGKLTLSGTASASNNHYFISSTAEWTLKAGHKYLVNCGALSSGKVRVYDRDNSVMVFEQVCAGSYAEWQIFAASDTANATYQFFFADGTTVSGTIAPMLFDLTEMFGAAVADAIYTMEQTTAGAGVAWFRRYFPKDYYAYDPGSLQSVRVSAHRTVGFNAFHLTGEDYGMAQVVGGMEYQIVGALDSDDVYLDGVAVVPDEQGYFTPPHSGELYIGSADETTCVHLVRDGERDGEFEAYEAHVYPLDDTLELRGLFGIDASGNLTADGDEYAPDGTVTRKYAVRAYMPGDEDEDAPDMITDGTHTVYKLAAPTTETAAPYDEIQDVNDWGTEEFVDAGIAGGDRDVAVPVGHVTLYPPNLRAELERVMIEVPKAPTENGTYQLKATVTDGTTVFAWVVEN